MLYKSNLAYFCFVVFVSCFFLDAGAKEWKAVLLLGIPSVALGAALNWSAIPRQRRGLAMFGLVQCLYYPLATLVLLLTDRGPTRQTLAVIAILLFVAASTVAALTHGREVRDEDRTAAE